MNNIRVNLPMQLQAISDVLCSALEGGSNYWYQIENQIEPTTWKFNSEPIGEHYLHDYPLNPGGALLISDTTEDNDHGTRCLGERAIQRGLSILGEKYPWHLANILTENADADTGDALLQCCLFDDIIYS